MHAATAASSRTCECDWKRRQGCRHALSVERPQDAALLRLVEAPTVELLLASAPPPLPPHVPLPLAEGAFRMLLTLDLCSLVSMCGTTHYMNDSERASADSNLCGCAAILLARMQLPGPLPLRKQRPLLSALQVGERLLDVSSGF